MPKKPNDQLAWISPPLRAFAVPMDSLTADPQNARRHPTYNLEAIRRSLDRFGQQKPIVCSADRIVRCGNGTLAAAMAAGRTMIAAVISELSPAEIEAYAIADNRSGELAEWDPEKLRASLARMPTDLQAAAGWTDAALRSALGQGRALNPAASLQQRFGVPPFSVLDARQGYWQDRKRHWLALGIRSELGRHGDPGGSPRPAADYSTGARGDGAGKPIAGTWRKSDRSGGPLDRREAIKNHGDGRRSAGS